MYVSDALLLGSPFSILDGTVLYELARYEIWPGTARCELHVEKLHYMYTCTWLREHVYTVLHVGLYCMYMYM